MNDRFGWLRKPDDREDTGRLAALEQRLQNGLDRAHAAIRRRERWPLPGAVPMTKKPPRSSSGTSSCGRLTYKAAASAATPPARARTMIGTVSARSRAERYQRVRRPIVASIAPIIRPPPPTALSAFEQSIGVRLSATKVESATAEARTRPNSVNSRPMSPGMNEIGTKTAMRARLVPTTANVTCRAPDRRRAGALPPHRPGAARSPRR